MLYFSWIDPEETFNPSHHRLDEKIVSVHWDHKENDCARCTIRLYNSFKRTEKKTWMFLSVKPRQSQEVICLMKGRLLTSELCVQKDIWEYTFLACSPHHDQQKLDLWNNYKSHNHEYDPLFFPEDNDNPDNILFAQPKVWYTDPVSHNVGLSDLCTGEDFAGKKEIFSQTMQYQEGKIVTEVKGAILSHWLQEDYGYTDIMPQIEEAFPKGHISSLGHNLCAHWPEKGRFLGRSQSYFVARSHLKIQDQNPILVKGKKGIESLVQTHYQGSLWIGWQWRQWRKEWLTFSLKSDFLHPQEPKEQALDLVLRPIPNAKQTPIWQGNYHYQKDHYVQHYGSLYQATCNHTSTLYFQKDKWNMVSRGEIPTYQNTFFLTDRGKKSAAYGFDRAKKLLIEGGRGLTLSFCGPWKSWIGITLNHQVSVHHPSLSLPNQKFTGKVTHIEFVKNQESEYAKIVIKAMPELSDKSTEPTQTVCSYAQDYVDPEYQVSSGGIHQSANGVQSHNFDDQYPANDVLHQDRLKNRLKATRVYNDAIVGGDTAPDDPYQKASIYLTFDALDAQPCRHHTISAKLIPLQRI